MLIFVLMMDINLFWRLFSAIDLERTQVLLVGDANQLPPIGPGYVLRDVINHGMLPFHILDQCFRSAGTLKANCNAILNGKLNPSVEESAEVQDWFVNRQLEDPERVVGVLRHFVKKGLQGLGYDPVQDCQIITPQNRGVLGVSRLNRELQRVWQSVKYGLDLPEVDEEHWDKRPKILPGDKVMMTKNDYELGVMNGTQGIVLEVQPNACGPAHKADLYVIQWDDFDEPQDIDSSKETFQNIVLAYAVTIHKVQGSEYPCVVAVLHKKHAYMLSRNLIYTAATRARRGGIILGDNLGMRRGLAQQGSLDRRTWMQVVSECAGKESGN
jgi:exodeoxyribonuclease V alpha subunit